MRCGYGRFDRRIDMKDSTAAVATTKWVVGLIGLMSNSPSPGGRTDGDGVLFDLPIEPGWSLVKLSTGLTHHHRN